MRYEIFQVNQDRIREVAFRSFTSMETVRPADYHSVYTGEVAIETDTTALEHLFYIFNVHLPDDFTGYSLSMADVVVLDRTRAYYCDTVGWKALGHAFAAAYEAGGI